MAEANLSVDQQSAASEHTLGGGRLGALFLTVFLDLLGFGLVMPLLPRYAESFEATPLQIGFLGASYSVMQFIFLPLWGQLSDRIGRRPVLLGSILILCCSMLILGLAPSLGWLVVARIIGGIATANIATAQAYIADTTTPEARARGMGLLGMAFGLGFVLGPFFGGMLAIFSLAAPAFAAGALAFINFLWSWWALPESLPKHRRRVGGTLRIGLNPKLTLETFRVPGLGVALGLFFVVCASFANMEQTFSLYAHDAFALGPTGTGYIFGVVGLTAAVVQGGLSGRLNRRFGELWLIRAGTLLQASGFMMLALAKGHGLIALYVSVITLSVGNGLWGPAISTLVSKRALASSQGTALGVLQAMGSLARVFGPIMGGFLYGYDERFPFMSGAIGLFVGWLIALSLKSTREAAPAATVASAVEESGEGAALPSLPR